MREATPQNRGQRADLAVLLLLVIVVYGRLVRYGFLANWDDNWYVIYNESVRGVSWEHLKTAFSTPILGQYAPIQTLSFMFDHTLWGLAGGGFHLTNIVLHTINGVLVYQLFIYWQKDRLYAFAATAVFLFHPLQVESVAWISARKNLLSMSFFLLSWEAYRRYRDSVDGRLYYVFSVMAFAISLLAKPMTIIFPAVLIMYDVCFTKGYRRLHLKDKIPFMCAAAVIAAVTILTQSLEGGGRVAWHGGSPMATFFTMLTVFQRYLGMLFWPSSLSAYYAPTIHRTFDPAVLKAAILLSCVSIASVLLYRKDRRLGFWVLFFFTGFITVSHIVPMLSIMNDRYFYLPLMGAGGVAGAGAVWLREWLGPRHRGLLYGLLALPLLALSIVTFQRTALWRDSLTLWSDAVLKEPASDKAWSILGEVYTNAGKNDLARQAYERGLKLNPLNAETLQGLGDLYTETGEIDKGYTLLKKLLEIRPTYVTGWASLGNNYMKRGNYDEAEQAYLHAHDLQPEAMQLVTLLGDLERVRGRLDRAREYYLKVEAKGGGFQDIAYHLACVEAMAGNTEESLEWLNKALERGFNDYGKLFEDAQLSSVRENPRFTKLIRRYFPQ